MNLHKQEDHHNSPEQVEGYSRVAVEIADRLGLTPEDRAVLLPVIASQLAAKEVFYEQVPSAIDLAGLRPQG